MPNWAYNSMTVRSQERSPQVALHDLTTFIEAIRAKEGEGYDFTRLHPMPEYLRDTTAPASSSPEPHPNWAEMVKKGEMTTERYDELCADQVARYEAGQRAKELTGYTDWYSWAVSNWGTKWSPVIENLRLVTDSEVPHIEIYYETAWSPCDGLVAKMSEAFPGLTFLVEVTEEADLFIGASLFIAGEQRDCYATFDSSSFPEPFAKRFSEAEKIWEDESKDDEDKYEEWSEFITEFRSDFLEFCVKSLEDGEGTVITAVDRKVDF